MRCTPLHVCLLEDGANGVERDVARAAAMFQKANDAGDVDTLFRLALMLDEDSEDSPRDAKRAAKLYERVIEEDGDV